jgi:hypothetical protein
MSHLESHAQDGPEGLLFPDASGTGFLTPSLLYGIKPGRTPRGKNGGMTKGRGYYLARVVAGRPDANWHQLRAFAVSEAVDAGATPADLLRRFGHTDLKTSGLYQRAAADADTALASRLDVALPPEPRATLRVVGE